MAHDGDSLPSPDDFKEYEKACPGMGRELVAMAKAEQQHLQDMERRDYVLSSRGQLFGFLIALAFLAAATFLIYTHHDTAGTIIGSTDLVALVAVFVVGRRTSSIGKDNSIDSLIKELSKQPRSPRKLQKSKKRSVTAPKPDGSDSAETQMTGAQPAEPQPDKPSAPDSSDSSSTDDENTSAAEVEPTEVPAETTADSIKRPKVTRRMSEEDRVLYDKLWKRPSTQLTPPQDIAE
jgi:uncharacterized membrane protein